MCSVLHSHVEGYNKKSAFRSLWNIQIKDRRDQKSLKKPSGNSCVLTSLFLKLTQTLARWQADTTDFWGNSAPHCGLMGSSPRYVSSTQCNSCTYSPSAWSMAFMESTTDSSLMLVQGCADQQTSKLGNNYKSSHIFGYALWMYDFAELLAYTM